LFRRILIGSWSLYLATVALVFAFPKYMLRVFSMFGFSLSPVGYALPILLLVTGTYLVFALFRRGMKSARGVKSNKQ